ncbi:MAG: transcription antitermination factor NusB [Oscillospiraceae bacterium]|nr:transcription antitermination factor NusB [Oscillospiraceae bacterium]
MTRSQKREAVFLLLYQSSLNDDTVDELVQTNIEEFEMLEDDSIAATVKSALEYADQADKIINRFSKTRKVARIAKISVAIMRLALYEMEHDDTVPDKVAINEAIELCKKYSGENDAKFVSGLLGSYYREKNNE